MRGSETLGSNIACDVGDSAYFVPHECVYTGILLEGAECIVVICMWVRRSDLVVG